MKKKLAVLGCGIAAVPILKKAREMEVETYCFALEELPCAKGLSNFFLPISYTNIDAICSTCKNLNIDGVIASSENTTEAAAEVAYNLGLPGNRFEGGFCGKDKYLMRQCLKESKSVRQPTFYHYEEGRKISYPVIVKAPDSCSKQGISFVKNEKELKIAIEYALNATSQHQVLIEEYIGNGVEYSVECLSSHNKHYIIQITKKDTAGPPHFLEIGHHQPGALNEMHYQLIHEKVPEILTAVGICNSMAHVEIKITEDNQLYFIELGARAGGDRIADTLLALSVDYDYYKGAIQIALNEFETPVVNNVAYSGIYYLSKQTESIMNLFSVAKNANWCIEINTPKGDLTYASTNINRDELGGYIIYRSDHKIVAGVDAPWKAVRFNDNPNAVGLMRDFYMHTGRQIAEEELLLGLQKFVDKGNVFAIFDEGKIIALLNVYCNNFETKIAYINNVEVLRSYRGKGLSKIIMNSALTYCTKQGFKTVTLHVAPSNIVAEKLYLSLGFEKTGVQKKQGEDLLNEYLLKL
ncbi:GNAT family N-acetyltransferase [Macellibacteroides fermentans]|uniref:Biotin carboxylase n=1 Tax=Parabacteroides chartae TaxID=1037355 RepID=A0A1T5ANN4_9BACT|nr:GNAT family N-acetyltransferase [Parabacteroides chartae]SKB36651.1 Biotin carboxylase [Parabacteroides chartae]